MKVFGNIRLALALLLLVLTGLLGMVAYQEASELLGTTVREREIDKIQTIASVAERLIAQLGERATQVARLLVATNESVGESPGPDPLGEIARRLEPVFRTAQLDVLELTDDRETIVYRAQDPARKGDRAKGWGVFEALSGRGQVVGSIDDEGVVIRAIEPLRVGDRIIGTLSVGTRLDERFLKALSLDVRAEVALVTRSGQAVKTSPGFVYALDPKKIAAAFEQKIPILPAPSETHPTVVYFPILVVDEGSVIVVQLDSSAAWQVLERNSQSSVIYSLVIFVVIFLVGLVVLQYLMRPLQRLRASAERIGIEATGEPITADSRDEVASVVQVLETLTDRLVRRNRELVEAERRMAEAHRAAEAASRAKSDFLATMSHEIRTPLNGVLGMAGLLAEARLDRSQKAMVETIRQSGESLLAVINDILDFSKIEAGRMDLEISELDLVPLIESTVDVVLARAQKKQIEIAYAVAPDAAGRYLGDSGRMRQILLNLVSNAVKFTEAGTVTVEVTRERQDARTWLRLSVSDTGIGIAEADLPRLFRHFSQLDSQPSRRFGGSGLGLAICRRLVELMGGTIGVESAVGRGSRFWLVVPLAPAPQRDGTTEAIPAWPGKARILIVDDLAVSRANLESQLAQLRVESESAAGAETAYGLLQSGERAGRPFAAALLDSNMHGAGGVDLARRIKADSRLRTVPLILLCAAAPPAGGDGDPDAGLFVARLGKPVKRSVLIETLDRALGAPVEQAAGQPAGAVATAEPPPPGRPLRVLIAEDNPVNQQVLAAMVGRLGHHCDLAGDGAEALAAVASLDYDVVLMDIQMPNMDGYAATAAIRALPAPRAGVPIVAVTANAFASDRERCLAAGMIDHVPKPVTLAALQAALSRLYPPPPGRSPCQEAADRGPPAPSAAAEERATRRAVGAALAELRREMGDLATRGLIDKFRIMTVDNVAKMRDGLERNDPGLLRGAAHSLKGAAAQLGLTELAELAFQLERSAAPLDRSAAEAGLQALERGLARVTDAIEAGDQGGADDAVVAGPDQPLSNASARLTTSRS